MIISIALGGIFGIFAWFIGCVAVMWHKYHKVKEFLNGKTFLKKKKIGALLLYIGVGMAAGGIFHIYGWYASKIFKYLVLIYGMLLISYVDHQSHIIPNKILLVLFGIRWALLLVEMILYPTAIVELLSSALGGMIIGFIIFILAYFISKKGIGLGDVKLVAVIGFYTGTSVLYAIMILSLFSCVVYSIVQLIRKKITTKSFVAFGPFVAIGTILALFLGI